MLVEKMRKRLETFRLKQESKRQKKKEKARKNKKKNKPVTVKIKNVTLKKRKVGRPKKRGPKKKRVRKKIIKPTREYPVIDFKIVSAINGKQNGYVGSCRTYAEALSKMQYLEKLNNDVVFPRKYINKDIISNIKEEYLVLEKNRSGNKENTMLRDEYGKFVEQKITNNNKWVIRNKMPKLTEETFWVYGYDPKSDRKTATWIYENIILGKIETVYDVVRIMVYKNKLVVRYDDMSLSMVLCKNKSDSIRLYNFISEKQRIGNTRQIVCLGACDMISDKRRELESDLMELTGWNKSKIQRSTN